MFSVTIDFTTPDYLLSGTDKQKEIHMVLEKSGVLSSLSGYNPILTGTFPIGIDVPGSDLDIICQITDREEFIQITEKHFSGFDRFEVVRTGEPDNPVAIVRFFFMGYEFEIFAQNIPVLQQNAYRHMVIEHALLVRYGEDFRKEVIRLKRSGIKTEPAFARLLHLPGDPYAALLSYEL